MRHTAIVAVLGCLLAAILTVSTAKPAVADDEPPVSYSPPVPGAVVDDWRPPTEKWGAGNRGVDFDADAGEAVHAAAAGEVVFAGPVAGSLHVVVLHADGFRTSYSFLGGIAVRRGDRVAAGAVVGTAGGPLHFGARAGDTYLDPLALLGDGPPRVHLVDDRDRRPAPVAVERGALERFVRASGRLAARAATGGTAWVRDRAVVEAQRTYDRARAAGGYLGEHAPPLVAYRIAAAGITAATRACTPAGVPPPALPSRRRLLVRVAGLDSHTGTGADAADAGAIADLDAAALGYPAGDVVQFSYAGGTTRERPYSAADSQRPIRESGVRLGALLDRLAADHPGVPIDVVAHSQGGLVARAALTTTAAPVDHVVTFGTPHHGADVASALRAVAATTSGAVAEAAVGMVDPMGFDPGAPSVRDLAEGSAFLTWINGQPLPAGVRFTSIAARRDLLVPVPRAHLDGATNVVVDPGGLNQHDALPGSPEAGRAAALALAGSPPPCESPVDAMVDAAAGEAISAAEDAAGTGLATALR